MSDFISDEDLRRRLHLHMERDEQRAREDQKIFDEINEDIRLIKENHLAHMQVSIATLSVDMAATKNRIEDMHETLHKLKDNFTLSVTDVEWLKWGMRGLLVGMGGLVVSAIVIMLQLFSKR